VKVSTDGRRWHIGTIRDVDWIADGTTPGTSIIAAIPPIFEAYATFYQPDRSRSPLTNGASSTTIVIDETQRQGRGIARCQSDTS